MLPGSNNTDVSVRASDQPACWTPGLVLVVADFVDKINKPKARRHHSTRVCRKPRETILLMKFHKLLILCIGGIIVANVIIWTNKILLVGKTAWNDSLWNDPSISGQ